MSGFQSGDRKTMLHMAACDGDVALGYEVIRMGIDIDRKDKNGVTALLLSLAKLVIHRTILNLVTSPNFPPPPPGESLSEALKPEYLNKRIECDARIATLLIEQHADVNAGAFDVTPMSLAAESGRWSIVELLLQHGALRARTDGLHFASTIEKSRYLSILSKTKPKSSLSDPRPPRPCPCWSGKLLSECHATGEKPYPDNFVCGCGKKNRSFGECCGRRGIQVVEEWDPEDKWIMPSTIRTMRYPTEDQVSPDAWTHVEAGMRKHIDIMRSLDAEQMQEAVEMLQQSKIPMFRKVLSIMGLEDRVDPAYWYALDKVDFFPQPWEGQLSKVEAHKRMEEWNTAVDEYISTVHDYRPRIDIEIASKIGMNGGPLYKRCQADDCNKAEKRDLEKLLRCGSCEATWYCSKECQKKGWNGGHKEQCRSGKARPQDLDSQWAMQQAFIGLQGAAGM
ncbi:hypothetical protein VNI00_013203 [Paramarasmius palmivorus]|uniref:MYND-type domain-containing protein n=1 Tax=Paramarasmius palmivorus TaxID=297713 RepID=A0AAW0C047_9AGAR